MGVYNNNKDGTRSTLANTIQVVDAPMEQFISRGEFSAVTPNDVSADNKLVAENEVTKAFETMPTASASLVGTIVQYVGTTTANYTNGYFYKCVSDGAVTPTYSWVEVISGGGSGADLPWVIPQDYGAVGDGVTDDTTAIQNAFNAVRTNGGAVYFPKGTYIVSATIRIYSNITVLGDKGQAIIKIIDSINSPIAMIAIGDNSIAVSNVIVKDLIFRGTETYGTSQGGVCLMDIWNGTNISITNCLFQNNMYAAIRLIGNTSNIRVFSCRFEACDMGVASLGSVAVSDVTVRNCHFTGVSSLNNFTNTASEQVGTFTSPSGGISYRWAIEDCIFEYKSTNAIAFNVSNPPSDNTIYAKDCVIRNCTFRYCSGGVYVYHNENISIDGLFFDDTLDKETSLGFSPYRLFSIERSNHVTVRNVTSDSKQIKTPIQVRYSSDVLIDGVDAYVDTLESPTDLPFAQFNNVSKLIAKNFHFNPISSDRVRAIIQMTTLTDSYIDLHGDAQNGSVVYLYTSSPNTLSGNIFVIDNDNTVTRNFTTYLTTVADTNTYRLIGTAPYSKKNITDINKYYIYRRWNIGIDSQGQYDTSLAVTDFTLLNDGAELLLEFQSTSYTNGKTFTFNKTGNIIPIDQPFTFSNDYVVVCKFVQKNAKWVEVERILEYYEGADVDIDGTQPAQFEVTTSGWVADTTSQSGTTLYKKSIALTQVNTEMPTISIGATGTLPTVAQQAAFDLVQYVTLDSAVPCLYLYASAIPTDAFYIKVEGVV